MYEHDNPEQNHSLEEIPTKEQTEPAGLKSKVPDINRDGTLEQSSATLMTDQSIEMTATTEEFSLPHSTGPIRTRRLVKKDDLQTGTRVSLTAQQRLLLLDTWRRSGLPAGDFAALVGVSKHTLYAWKKRFDDLGPAGLLNRQKRGPRGSSLPELTKRTILMLKESNPDWGCQRISDMLLRGP